MERRTDLVHSNPDWSWWLFVRWALLICAVAVSGSGMVAFGFFLLIAIPFAITLNVAIGVFAFWIPLLAFPVLWLLGMIHCYRRHPSAKLMAALAAAGTLVFTLLPIAISLVVLAASGGWSVK